MQDSLSPLAFASQLLLHVKAGNGSICTCGYGRCFNAASSALWLGLQASDAAFPTLNVSEALDPMLDRFVHETSTCPGGARLRSSLDDPLSTFWEHDLGILGLGPAAFGIRNRSIDDRYAFIGMAEMLTDSYPTSPLTRSYASTAKLLVDGTLAKNISGKWHTKWCHRNGTAAPDCGIVWAEDAVIASTLLSSYAAAFGADDGGVGRAAATRATGALLGATKRLRLPGSALFAHGFDAANDAHSCCALSSVNGALALSHLRLLGVLNCSFPGDPTIPSLRSTLLHHLLALVEQQQSGGGWPHVLHTGVQPARAAACAEATGTALIVAALASAVLSSALLALPSSAAAEMTKAARHGFGALTSMLAVGGGLTNVTPAQGNGTLLLGTLRNSAAEYDAEGLGGIQADVALGAALLASAAVSTMGAGSSIL